MYTRTVLYNYEFINRGGLVEDFKPALTHINNIAKKAGYPDPEKKADEYNRFIVAHAINGNGGGTLSGFITAKLATAIAQEEAKLGRPTTIGERIQISLHLSQILPDAHRATHEKYTPPSELNREKASPPKV